MNKHLNHVTLMILTSCCVCADRADSQSIDSLTINTKSGIKIEFVYIPPGEFTMGREISAIENLGRSHGMTTDALDESPAHRVELTKGYFVARYKITAFQYCIFLNSVRDEERTDKFVVLKDWSVIEKNKAGIFTSKKNCENCAINSVAWDGANRFCDWMSEESGWRLRLPTEAEWEFAARGPKGRNFPWGDESFGKVDYDPFQPVDAFPHNTTPEGVVGMINSVGDWVSDYYSETYPKEYQKDPTGPLEALEKSGYKMGHVLRRCRNSCFERASANIHVSPGYAGFRPILELQK